MMKARCAGRERARGAACLAIRKGRRRRWVEPWGDRRGVTLIELMIVVAIISVIAAIAIALYQDVTKKARLSADLDTVGALRSAIAIYYGRYNGIFPALVTVPTLVNPPPVFQCTGGGYNYSAVTGVISYTPNSLAAC